MSEDRNTVPVEDLLEIDDDTEAQDASADGDAAGADGEGADGVGGADAADDIEILDQGEGRPQEAPQHDGNVRGRHRGGRESQETRFQRASAARADAERRAEEAERRLNEILAREDAQRRAQQDQQFVQQLAELPPDRAYQAILERTRAENQQQIQQTRFQLWQDNDRARYEAEVQAEPKFAQFNARVEELARQAPGVSRLDLLDKAIGEAARLKMRSAITRQRNRGAASAAANQIAAPASGRGDQPAQRQRTGSTPASRLEGVPI
jgi:hypothetical protein